MPTFLPILASGGTNGRMVLITATTTTGNTLHTAVAGTSDIDEVWIWATNNHSSTVSLTLEFGGTTAPNDLIQMAIPSKQGAFLLVPGWRLNNEATITAFASVANVISCQVNVNRYTS